MTVGGRGTEASIWVPSLLTRQVPLTVRQKSTGAGTRRGDLKAFPCSRGSGTWPAELCSRVALGSLQGAHSPSCPGFSKPKSESPVFRPANFLLHSLSSGLTKILNPQPWAKDAIRQKGEGATTALVTDVEARPRAISGGSLCTCSGGSSGTEPG